MGCSAPTQEGRPRDAYKSSFSASVLPTLAPRPRPDRKRGHNCLNTRVHAAILSFRHLLLTCVHKLLPV